MRLFSALLALSLLAVPVRGAAQAPPPAQASQADRAAIVGVIEGQLEAFRRADAGGAFAFASPGIQAMFGTPETFMGMVRTGYAPVYAARSARFLELGVVDGRLAQRVLLTGPDGSITAALYFMEPMADGSWRIAGCVLLEGADA